MEACWVNVFRSIEVGGHWYVSADAIGWRAVSIGFWEVGRILFGKHAVIGNVLSCFLIVKAFVL